MKQYVQHGVNLSPEQAKKIVKAYEKGSDASIRLTKSNLVGSFQLPLTQTQLNKIKNSVGGVELNLSKSQLKHMKKTGGFLPLATLIPALGGILGGIGGLTTGIVNAVSSAKNTTEQARHNKATEEILKTKSAAEPLLEKVGLGFDALNKCNCELRKVGYGLFLAPVSKGDGLFLDQ